MVDDTARKPSRRSSSKSRLPPAERMLQVLPRTGLATPAQLEHLAEKYPAGGHIAMQALLNLMQSGVVDCISWQRDCWLPEVIGQVTGKDGDKMELIEPVPLPPTAGSTLHATEICLELMFNQLRDSVQKEVNKVIGENQSLEELAEKSPMQVCLLVQRVRFTKNIEDNFRWGKTAQDLKPSYLELKGGLQKKLRSQQLEDNERATGSALALLLCEQIGILEEMAKTKDQNEQRQIWKEKHRFYHEKTKDGENRVKMAVGGSDMQIEIGNEYCAGPHLVSTDLTQTMRWAYTKTMNPKPDAEEDTARVLVLCGEPACGKTDTLRDVGRLLGTLPTVCRATSDIPTEDTWWLRQLEAHMNSAGGPLAPFILYKADRAPEAAIKQALACAEACGVALCMTLTNGPTAKKLEEGLLANATVVNMQMPDPKTVASALLAAEGIVDHESLAGKLATVLKSLQEKVVDQTHYDFGLRTLRQLITQIGEELREHSFLKADEAAIVIMRRCLAPKLLHGDLLILQEVMTAAMGSPIKNFCACSDSEGGRWRAVMDNVRDITTVEPDCMVLPVKEEEEQSFFESFSKLLNSSGHTMIKLPKKLADMTPAELLGSMPKAGEKVTDGILINELRKTLDVEETVTVWFAIATGRCNPDMWEAINPILDDSGCFNLATGEQLRWGDNVRFLFVLPGTEGMPKDTFSRTAVVFTDPR